MYQRLAAADRDEIHRRRLHRPPAIDSATMAQVQGPDGSWVSLNPSFCRQRRDRRTLRPRRPPRCASGATPIPTATGQARQRRSPRRPIRRAAPRAAAGVKVPVHLAFATDHFGMVALDRDRCSIPPRMDGRLRWTSATLYPELGASGTLRLRRQAPVRGRIVAQDGTVFARTRGDGASSLPAGVAGGPDHRLRHAGDGQGPQGSAARGFAAATWSGAAAWSTVPMSSWPAAPASSWSRSRPTARRSPCSSARWCPAPMSRSPPAGIQATADAHAGPLRRGRHRRAEPEQRRCVGAGIGTRFNPNAMTRRLNHQWRRAGAPRLAARIATMPCWPPTRPARRSRSSRWLRR